VRELALAPEQVATSSSSSCWMARVSDGCATLHSSAARVKFSTRAAAGSSDLMHFHGIRPTFTKINIYKNLPKALPLHNNLTASRRRFDPILHRIQVRQNDFALQ